MPPSGRKKQASSGSASRSRSSGSRSWRCKAISTLADPATTRVLVNDRAAAPLLAPLLARGGTALFCGLVSSFTDMNQFAACFQSLGLPWRPGAYYHTDLHPTPAAESRLARFRDDLPEQYNAKALLATSVAPADRIYAPSEDSYTQSMVFAPESADSNQAAVALGRASGGWVGYVGDVNGEEETSDIILTILKWAGSVVATRAASTADAAARSGARAGSSGGGSGGASGSAGGPDGENVSEVFNRVAEAVAEAASQGLPQPSYSQYSEAWYWQQLVKRKPFRSVYSGPGREQPLLSHVNISQTPREECEIMGIVTADDGLRVPGPGLAVVLTGLQKSADLNGQRGRIMPSEGPGAPSLAHPHDRIPVRLQGSFRELAVKSENLMAAVEYDARGAAAGAGAGAGAAAGGGAGAGAAAGPGARAAEGGGSGAQAAPSGALADLIRADVRRGMFPPLIKRNTLTQAGMPAHLIECCVCGGAGQEGYVGLKRTTSPSANRVDPSTIRLQCVDCLIRQAQGRGVREEEGAVGEFVESVFEEQMSVIMQLQGHPAQVSGGISNSSTLY